VKKAVVIGLARSGRAAALALSRRGVEVVGVDRAADLEHGDLAESSVEVRLGPDDPAVLEGADVVVKSPGVPGDQPLVVAARSLGIPVWSEVELGARLLPNPMLGVTGTNGKTTTAELLGAVFRAAGRPVEVAGNIGRPLTGLVDRVADDALVVCELSSFQLEDIDTLRPQVAVLLNLEPDHLDRHGTLERYRDAKLRVFENQQTDDVSVVPYGFGPVPGHGRRIEFRWDDELPAELAVPGRHNRENAAAAAAASRALGVGDTAIAQAFREFPGVRHRLEQVAERDGVRYVNDSKATNVGATLRALEALAGERLHVIVGGYDKGESFEPLASALSADSEVYLLGASAQRLAEALSTRSVSTCGTLEAAVSSASARARAGDVVLLSPACASYDQFADFEERGDRFRELVAALS
jgi:UDP-N-acetylmuramoylalanine--D-glutamate ligase